MELYNKENSPPTIANAFEMERLEGKQEVRRKIALNLLKQNLPLEMIATATELTVEELEDMQKKIK